MHKILIFSQGKTNRHGTQKKAEPWNQEMIKGPKLKFYDLKEANKSSTI